MTEEQLRACASNIYTKNGIERIVHYFDIKDRLLTKDGEVVPGIFRKDVVQDEPHLQLVDGVTTSAFLVPEQQGMTHVPEVEVSKAFKAGAEE